MSPTDIRQTEDGYQVELNNVLLTLREHENGYLRGSVLLMSDDGAILDVEFHKGADGMWVVHGPKPYVELSGWKA